MNTAEKVARLEALLQRVQTNAKQPRAPRRASVPQTDVAARAGSVNVETLSAAAEAARAASSGLEAQRSAAERASKEASERVAREAAEKAASLRAAADAAAREMAERSAKEASERAAREAAERAAREAREAAERSAREAAAREAAAAKERAAKEAAERAAKEAAEKAAREAAAAKEKAAREATERAAKEAAAKEKAAKEAADKAAKEKAAKEASERAAKEKAAKEAAAREAADKAAKEKAAKEATEKAAKERLERATKEATERAAKTAAEKVAAEKVAAEKAAKEAAAGPPKKEPSTIDELFAELELGGGEPTKSGHVLPAELIALAAEAAPPRPVKPDPIKDEPTFDAGDLPTLVGSMEDMPTVEGPKKDEDLPTRTAPPPLPLEGPTRVVESYAAILDPPTLDSPSIVFGDSSAFDRSPEPDEPTVIRRPSAKDQALVRGELLPDPTEARRAEAKTARIVVVDEETAPLASSGEPRPQPAGGDVIAPLPIITVGDVAAAEQAAKATDDEDKAAGPKPLAGTHEPKVALAEPLREAAEKAAKEAAEVAAEKAAKEAALRPKPDKKEPVREEITTASRRMAQLSPELIAAQMQEREREREEKNESTKKKGRGSTIGLLVATILLVGGGVFVGMRNGWFETTTPPAPTTTAQTGPTARTTAAPPRTVQPATSGTPTATQAQVPTAAPTASASAVPSVEPTAAPAINPAAAAQPGVPIVDRTDETKKLNSTKAYLTLVSPEDGFVYVTGKKIGPANQRHEVNCGVGLVRFGVPLPNGGVDWRSPPGMSIPLPCRASTTVAVTPSKGPWKTPGGNRLPGGGGGEDPY